MPYPRGPGGTLPPTGLPSSSLDLVNRALPSPVRLAQPVAWLERAVVRAVPRGPEGGLVVDDGERVLLLGDPEVTVLASSASPWAVAGDGSVLVGERGRVRRHPLDGPPEVLASARAPITMVAVASAGRAAWWSGGQLGWRRGDEGGSVPLEASTGRAPRLAWMGAHVLVAGGRLRHRVLRLHGDRIVGRWQLPGPVLACAGSAHVGVVLALDLEQNHTVLGLLDPDGHVELVPVPEALAWDGAGDRVAWVDETGVLHAVDAEGDVSSRALPTDAAHGIGLDPSGRSACVWERPDADAGAPVWVVAL